MKRKAKAKSRKQAISIPDLERRLIWVALKQHQGSTRKTSADLGISESIVKAEARKIWWRFKP